MQRTVKPKNARSKRALEARESKVVEDAKTCIFVRGSQTSERVRTALNELQLLKRPHAISFSKRNAVHPFDDPAPLLFWHTKNDSSLFLHASHSKKRPHNLTFLRLFDGRILDMLEVGVEGLKSIKDFPGPKASPGVTPLFHFVGDVWEQDQRYGQFRNTVLDFFRGEQMKAIDLVHGLQYVISVSVGSVDDDTSRQSLLDTAASLASAPAPPSAPSAPAEPASTSIFVDSEPSTSRLNGLPSSSLPLIHFRTYSITLLRSGHLHPRVSLSPHGPFLDLRLRRIQTPADDVLKQALKKQLVKIKKEGERAKNKNIETDEMGDKVGRVHLGRQDLGKLQSRKMRGLKRGRDEEGGSDEGSDDDDDEAEEGGLSDLEMERVGGGEEEEDEELGAVVEIEPTEGSVKRRRT